MIVDLILERKEEEEFKRKYVPKNFYLDCMEYGEIGNDITRVMDGGTEADVKKELCNYIINNGYNEDICNYINSRNWIE